MRTRLILALTLAALGLAGCETPQGPTATCFSFLAGEEGCTFRAVPNPERPGLDA
jgi:hypothetical protein